MHSHSSKAKVVNQRRSSMGKKKLGARFITMVDIVVVKKEKYDRYTKTLFTFYKALNPEYP